MKKEKRKLPGIHSHQPGTNHKHPFQLRTNKYINLLTEIIIPWLNDFSVALPPSN